MPHWQSRFGTDSYVVHEGWSATHLLPPSRLFGANGVRAGTDGRIYVAQLSGSRVSSLNPDGGDIEHLDTTGGEIIGPDDLVFDDAGNLYVTEFTENRVSVRSPNGATRVLQGEIFGSNPIAFHQGRLIVGECRPNARIMELDRNGGASRLILDNVPMTNAFDVGPDGMLYFPVMESNEIWRVAIEGGHPEVVARDLGVPDSVKFDRKGHIISTQVGSGQVLKIDPRNGERQVIADIGPGLDNSTFVGDRLFVSHMTGSIHEITAPGEMRVLNDKGLLWPMGVAAAANGSVYVADGSYAYASSSDGTMELVGMLFTPGYPGFHRGVAAAANDAWIVTTSVGEVKRYQPHAHHSDTLANGYDRLMGVAVAPNGGIAFVEWGTGRVLSLQGQVVAELATGLDRPTGVAIGADGKCYVAESGAGRVIRLDNGRPDLVIDGLGSPEGLAEHNGNLYIVDVAARELIACRTDGGGRRSIVSGLPVGSPSGGRRHLGPAGAFTGPMLAFAGIAAGPDGTLYVAADGEGSVLTLRPETRN